MASVTAQKIAPNRGKIIQAKPRLTAIRRTANVLLFGTLAPFAQPTRGLVQK
jgi:hypothetical protein